MKTKRIVSVLLCVAMLLTMLSATVVAASDTCIKLADTNGQTGYSAGKAAVNEWVVANDGGTVIFDLYVESLSTPTSGKASRLVVFSGDEPENYTMFDFTNSKFRAGESTAWITDLDTSNFNEYASRSVSWQKGKWYEVAFQFDGNEMTAYLDGIPMVSAEITESFANEYLLIFPQFCTIYIDNLRICAKDYNVRERVGNVYGVTDFTGISSVSGASYWDFTGAGYSVSTKGRPMPELSDMVPKRTVTPSIEGAYLAYSEGGGSGTVQLKTDFTNYKGFSVVMDIRTDRKSVLGNFAVRFGNNFIAGYDWDSGCFIISQRSGYGFNTNAAYIYAKTAYSIGLKDIVEFGVRQYGNTVSIYANGVIVAQATNDAFVAGYDRVEISCYRLGASIDNVVIAYPDYDIKERTGACTAFTFDESTDYINNKCAFFSTSTGYSVKKNVDAAAVVVSNVEASDGAATVNFSVKDLPDATAFELQVSYPGSMSVARSIIPSGLGGTSVTSATTSNPFIFTHIATDGSTITNADVLSVKFNTPAEAGDYTIVATLIPYVNDIPCAPITGSGTVTVPKAALGTGLPSGIAYDGETLSWDYVDGAYMFDLYILYYGDDYEISIDAVEDVEYYMPYEDIMSDPGAYYIRIYAYDENFEVMSVSNDFLIVVDEDGNVYSGLDNYRDALYNSLVALAEGPYSAANQATIDQLLSDAEFDMYSENDYEYIVEVYEAYAEMIADIPVNDFTFTEGLPAGIAYDGETLSWNSVSGTSSYWIYVICYGDDYENYIGKTSSNRYTMISSEVIPDNGAYYIRIYGYDANGNNISVSDDYFVIVDNGSVYTDLAEYCDVLYGRLTALAEGPYSAANQATIYQLLSDAKSDMAGANDYNAVIGVYESYAEEIASVPVTDGSFAMGDVNGDGSVTLNDLTILARLINGATVAIEGDADVDADGSITLNDYTKLNRIINGATIS